MKRIIAAAVLLIFVITAYLSGFYYINRTVQKTNTLLSDCLSAYDKEKDALKETEKLEKFWSNKEPTLSLFANHSSIDEIELAISSLRAYSNTEEQELFYDYWGTVKTLLHQLMEDTTPNVHSIL